MALRKLAANSAASIATGASAKTVAYIKAGANSPAGVRRLHVGPKGTSNADPRIAWSLHIAASGTHGGGTAMTITQVGGVGKGVGSLGLTGASAQSSTITGTVGTVVRQGTMLPNVPFEIPLNIDLAPGEELALVLNTSTSQNVDVSFSEIEE